MAGEAAVAVALGSLPEEYLDVKSLIELHRRLREVRQKIVKRMLEELRGETPEEILAKASVVLQQHAPEVEELLEELKRRGVDPIKASLEATVEGYAEVLRLDAPVGGGKTLADLLYSGDKLVGKMHEVLMAFFMRYTEIECEPKCAPEDAERLARLATLELAVTTLITLFRQGKLDKEQLLTALDRAIDEILVA
jgi:hypothetical protein